MIAHTILFRLRPDVTLPERAAILDAYARAVRDIPSIRRARVGRRVRIGRAYEAMTKTDFPYAAILEFDDIDGLKAYLDHPAHEEMATKLFAAVADTHVYHFEMDTSVDGLRNMLEDD